MKNSIITTWWCSGLRACPDSKRRGFDSRQGQNFLWGERGKYCSIWYSKLERVINKFPDFPSLPETYSTLNFGVLGPESRNAGIILKNFRKLQKIHYLAYFSKNFKNHALIFSAFGQKTRMVGKIFRQVWNFLRKIRDKNDFSTIFWIFVAKNRALENNIIFIQQFFHFEGGGPMFPPSRRLWVNDVQFEKSN